MQWQAYGFSRLSRSRQDAFAGKLLSHMFPFDRQGKRTGEVLSRSAASQSLAVTLMHIFPHYL